MISGCTCEPTTRARFRFIRIWDLGKNVPLSSQSNSGSDHALSLPTVTKRHSRFWPQQQIWLNQLHPEELSWYRSLNWKSLKPGFWSWLYRIFIEFDLRQWAVLKDEQLQGVLAWIPSTRGSLLWLACGPDADDEAITMLLGQAQRDLGYRQSLKLEHPEGMHEEAIQAAGFIVVRTLIWMHKNNAT